MGNRRTPGSHIGAPLQRRGDEQLITGRAEYTDDLTAPNTVYLSFYRSQYGHAQIVNIDTDAAAAHEDVLEVYTWEDIQASDYSGVISVPLDRLDVDVPGHPILARDRVRYQGQPIAAVVATDRYAAHHAASETSVQYDRLHGCRPHDAGGRRASGPRPRRPRSRFRSCGEATTLWPGRRLSCSRRRRGPGAYGAC